MTGTERRIDDANFLWKNNRKESAFLLVLVAFASISKLRYPKLKDNEAFKATLKDFRTTTLSVEYRGEIQPIEHIFYKWIRCELIHESKIPNDIEFQEEINENSMSVRAGGTPEFVLKLGYGWFFHFVESVMKAKENDGL